MYRIKSWLSFFLLEFTSIQAGVLVFLSLLDSLDSSYGLSCVF